MAGIYIHVPFCLSKCIYCGFYSVASTRDKEFYVKTLLDEIRLRRDYLPQDSIQTLYFGGGTPSLLTADELSQILQQVEKYYDASNLTEITLEANPEQLTRDYCYALRELGINRLSIGVQSFQEHVLRFMGRRHTAQQALDAVDNARRAGFENISTDLIYGVSERSDAEWAQELDTAFSLPIRHLSCYALTVEENSRLYKQIQGGKHAPVDDEQAARQYDLLIEKITTSGTPARPRFEQYEISNFCQPDFESRHNSAYWNHTPYLGLGPAAHSFDGHSRQWNPANLKRHAENIHCGRMCEELEELSPTDIYNETLLLSLRTRNGLDLNEIALHYGEKRVHNIVRHFESNVPTIWYENAAGRLRLTAKGLWFADGIAENLFIVD